jgi:hypothetical protein
MIDETIMNELLEQPGIKENVEKMTPAELDYFKTLLVCNGIYAQYVEERNGSV